MLHIKTLYIHKCNLTYGSAERYKTLACIAAFNDAKQKQNVSYMFRHFFLSSPTLQNQSVFSMLKSSLCTPLSLSVSSSGRNKYQLGGTAQVSKIQQ